MIMTVKRKKQSWRMGKKIQPLRSARLLLNQLMLESTEMHGTAFVLPKGFLQMRLPRLMLFLETRKIRRHLATGQLLYVNGSMSFLEAKWKKQSRLPESGTWRVLPIRTKCLCELN